MWSGQRQKQMRGFSAGMTLSILAGYDRGRLELVGQLCTESDLMNRFDRRTLLRNSGLVAGGLALREEGLGVGGCGAGGDDDRGEDQRGGAGRDQRVQGRAVWRGHGEDAVSGAGGSGEVGGSEGLLGVYDDGSAIGGGACGWSGGRQAWWCGSGSGGCSAGGAAAGGPGAGARRRWRLRRRAFRERRGIRGCRARTVCT